MPQYPPILYKLTSRAKKPTINADGSITVHSLDDVILDPGVITKVGTGLAFVSRDQIRKCTVLAMDSEVREHNLPFVMMPGVYPLLGNEIKIAVFSIHPQRVLLPFGTPLAKMVMIQLRPVNWDEMPVMVSDEIEQPSPAAMVLEEAFVEK